jgi:hypothetical protein
MEFSSFHAFLAPFLLVIELIIVVIICRTHLVVVEKVSDLEGVLSVTWEDDQAVQKQAVMVGLVLGLGSGYIVYTTLPEIVSLIVKPNNPSFNIILPAIFTCVLVFAITTLLVRRSIRDRALRVQEYPGSRFCHIMAMSITLYFALLCDDIFSNANIPSSNLVSVFAILGVLLVYELFFRFVERTFHIELPVD